MDLYKFYIYQLMFNKVICISRIVNNTFFYNKNDLTKEEENIL